ncbi:MAG: haloperoxidase, partial [Segetibacter sp.]
MKLTRLFISFVIIVLIVTGCKHHTQKQEFHSKDISDVITRMSDLMVHDVTNPPLAARFFSYACLSGYEIVSQNNPKYKRMYGVLNEYPDLQKPDTLHNYDYRLSAVLAIIETAKKMQPSGSLLEKYETLLLDSCLQTGMPEEVVANSKRYAVAISKKVLAYAKADRYNKISNFQRYTPLGNEGTWYPTPPAYIAAVEPYFNTIRPFTLDTCIQFKPTPPAAFSKDKNSAFYKLLLLNYKGNVPENHDTIAAFWDCNPFAVQDEGHLAIGIKKISPGAHWLGITGIACEKEKKSFDESMQIFTWVSVGLMDAFICCWDEKYRSNRIRPETAVRKLMDAKWFPLLQTPPFPEYPSGHSTIS